MNISLIHKVSMEAAYRKFESLWPSRIGQSMPQTLRKGACCLTLCCIAWLGICRNNYVLTDDWNHTLLAFQLQFHHIRVSFLLHMSLLMISLNVPWGSTSYFQHLKKAHSQLLPISSLVLHGVELQLLFSFLIIHILLIF